MDLSKLNDIEIHLASLRRISLKEFEEESYITRDEFQMIDCGHFKIHLGAGCESFSVPHNNVYSSISDYSHLQVIIEEAGKSSSEIQVVSPSGDHRFLGFDWKKYFYYRDNNGKDHTSFLGVEVPKK